MRIAALELHMPWVTYRQVILDGYGKRNNTVAAIKAANKKRDAKNRRVRVVVTKP
jgi:hypothetical protein